MDRKISIASFLLCIIIIWSHVFGGAISSYEDLAGKKIMALGDSITEQGDYLNFIEFRLRKQMPGKNFDIINLGLSGETVSGLTEESHPHPRPHLQERLKRAFAKLQPSLVLACYGMNDGIYHPQSMERDGAFHDGIRKLLWQTKQHKAGLILLTPPVFDKNSFAGHLLRKESTGHGFKRPYEDYDRVLQGFSRWIMLLDDASLMTIDFHQPMMDHLHAFRLTDAKANLSADGIHPDKTGHLIMANAFLKSLGLDVGTSTLASQLKTIEDDPMYQLIVKRNQIRAKGWLQYVGYTAGKTVQSDSVSNTIHQASELEFRIDQFEGKDLQK